MSPLYDLHVETQGGVYDLGRVVSVLALLELTPASLTSRGDARGLTIEMRIAGDERTCALCLARLQALVAVHEARLTPVAGGMPSRVAACA